MATMNDEGSGDGFPQAQGEPAFGSFGNTEARNHLAEWSFEQLDRSLLDDNYQESWLWGSDPFGILCTDQVNLLEGAAVRGVTSLPTTGFEYQ